MTNEPKKKWTPKDRDDRTTKRVVDENHGIGRRALSNAERHPQDAARRGHKR